MPLSPWPWGEYVGFLDHDDILKPHALAQVVRWLDADPALDLLYSDEDKLDPAGRFTEACWKPGLLAQPAAVPELRSAIPS